MMNEGLTVLTRFPPPRGAEPGDPEAAGVRQDGGDHTQVGRTTERHLSHRGYIHPH